jgi:hypothetical protein
MMTDSSYPKVTFGIIVLNGEPFTPYCLRSLYPFAHEIIVVEGGNEDVHAVTTPDGHSIDGTLETLWRFKKEEDPENKVQIITRNGFWPKKGGVGEWRTYQSRAYAERATGDYLWQVDIDEFYQASDMEHLMRMLREDPSITAVSFKTYTFWGREDIIVDSWPFGRGADVFHRLFKWGPGYTYLTHEPPTVLNEQGQDVRKIHWVQAKTLAKQGIYMFHQALLFPWQVKQKTLVYQDERPEVAAGIVGWAEANYFRLGNPYRVHNLFKDPSWLERYRGAHPQQVEKMMQDIRSKKIQADLRPMEDVDALLKTWRYRIGRLFLKVTGHFDRIWFKFTARIRRFLVLSYRFMQRFLVRKN